MHRFWITLSINIKSLFLLTFKRLVAIYIHSMSEPSQGIEGYLYLTIPQYSLFTYLNILYANTTGNYLIPKKPLLYFFSTSLDRFISDQAEFTHY